MAPKMYACVAFLNFHPDALSRSFHACIGHGGGARGGGRVSGSAMRLGRRRTSEQPHQQIGRGFGHQLLGALLFVSELPCPARRGYGALIALALLAIRQRRHDVHDSTSGGQLSCLKATSWREATLQTEQYMRKR